MIRLRDIKKTYRLGSSEVDVLKGISLDINNGEFVSIMGPSGSGKSTLMNIIGCLDRPSSGEYVLNNVKTDSMTEDELAAIRNRNLGFVFQTFNLLSRQTALENVELPLFYAGIKDSERPATESLLRVGLEKRLRHRPNELSGGERQRVAIARAMVLKPPVILADEPTGNLDSKTGAEIMGLFLELHKSGSTILLVTHDPGIAAYSERTIIIKDGLVLEERVNGARA